MKFASWSNENTEQGVEKGQNKSIKPLTSVQEMKKGTQLSQACT